MRLKVKHIIVFIALSWSAILGFIYYYKNPTWQRDSFQNLPHWEQQNHQKSLDAFVRSCPALIKQSPSSLSLCEQAKQSTDAKLFFETYFRPYKLQIKQKPYFTGYYSPTFTGSLVQKPPYNYPIYGKPHDLISFNLQSLGKELPPKQIYAKLNHNSLVSFDDREMIYKGSLINRAKVIAWVSNPLDALELEIQGAGIIQTQQQKIYLTYASENGHTYQPIGKFLVADKKLNSNEINMLTIRDYFQKHPDELMFYLIKNPSYVFFKKNQKSVFLGYRNIPLKPGYSAAVDKKHIAIGTPIFVNFNLPNNTSFNRLMVAHDVGGAIKGLGRVDVYFGASQKAQTIARQLKTDGTLWILKPNLS